MAELTEEYKEKTKPFIGSNFIHTIVFIVALKILHRFFNIQYTLALPLAYGVACLIEYRIPPRPPVSLPAWVVRVVSLTLILIMGLWVAPQILSYWIWEPVAYALSIFALMYSFFWLPSLYAKDFWKLNLLESNEPEAIKTRRKNLIRWALFSLVVAALFGVAIYYLNKP